MHDGIVGKRHGGVAGGARGGDGDVDGNFFSGLDADVLDFAVFYDDAAFFIQGEAGRDFVPVILDGELNAEFAALLFIAFGEHDDVAIEADVGALERDENGGVGDDRAFIVDGDAAVEIAVLDDAAEGIFLPFRAIHADDVEMRHEEQSAGGIGNGAGRKARDENAAARSAFVNFGGNAVLLKNSGDVFRGGELVARRIRRIDAKQALEPAGGFGGDHADIRLSGLLGLGLRLGLSG